MLRDWVMQLKCCAQGLGDAAEVLCLGSVWYSWGIALWTFTPFSANISWDLCEEEKYSFSRRNRTSPAGSHCCEWKQKPLVFFLLLLFLLFVFFWTGKLKVNSAAQACSLMKPIMPVLSDSNPWNLRKGKCCNLWQTWEIPSARSHTHMTSVSGETAGEKCFSGSILAELEPHNSG